jgi:hypothetical protein
MHCVYEQASTTAIVLSSVLKSLVKIRALKNLLESKLLNKDYHISLVDTVTRCVSGFQNILLDSYFTRVWTFQEQSYST